MKLNKNKFTMITGTLFLTLALTACGSNGVDDQGQGDSDGELHMIGNEDGELQDIGDQIFDDEDGGVDIREETFDPGDGDNDDEAENEN